MRVNILVLNYNGKDLLARCLPSLVRSAGCSRHACTVTVVDNASVDASSAYVRSAFPEVKLIQQSENLILCSYNKVLRDVDQEIVILLNNDIEVNEDFIDHLIRPFEQDDNVFMAKPKMLNGRGVPKVGATKAFIRWGLFWSSEHYKGFEKDLDRSGFTFSSGMGAFDRRKFLLLGGYDDMYLPGTLEDADLCFRAWQKGWRCLYQPESVICHMGQVSFHRRFGRRQTEIINFRNVFLFMWKNISDKTLLLQHIVFLPLWVIYMLIKRKPAFLLGFFQAVPRLSAALSRRRVSKQGVKRRDREIFAKFENSNE